MGEYEILKKAYDRLEKLYTKSKLQYVSLERKYKLMLKENKEMDELVEAHIRLNQELVQKLKKTEKELATLQTRQETGKKSTQTNKKA